VTGSTSSTNFPTVNALQHTYGGGHGDAFVAKLDAGGSALVYSTYLSGSGVDIGHGIAVDSTGNAYVTGITNSTSFPTAGALQNTYGGGTCPGGYTYSRAGPCIDAFVAKLNANGSALLFGTYLGGSWADGGLAIAVDGSNNAYVTGSTSSRNFPTAHAIQGMNGGGSYAFIAKIGDPQSSSLSRFFFILPLGIIVVGAGMFFVVRARRAPEFVPAGMGPGAARASSAPEMAHPGPPGASRGWVDTEAATAPPAPLAPPAAVPAQANVPAVTDGAACGQCGAKLVAGEPYCAHCGAPVVTSCRRCGRPLEPGKPFCPRCGARVQATNGGGA
jgi:hypothetical protein